MRRWYAEGECGLECNLVCNDSKQSGAELTLSAKQDWQSKRSSVQGKSLQSQGRWGALLSPARLSRQPDGARLKGLRFKYRPVVQRIHARACARHIFFRDDVFATESSATEVWKSSISNVKVFDSFIGSYRLPWSLLDNSWLLSHRAGAEAMPMGRGKLA